MAQRVVYGTTFYRFIWICWHRGNFYLIDVLHQSNIMCERKRVESSNYILFEKPKKEIKKKKRKKTEGEKKNTVGRSF